MSIAKISSWQDSWLSRTSMTWPVRQRLRASSPAPKVNTSRRKLCIDQASRPFSRSTRRKQRRGERSEGVRNSRNQRRQRRRTTLMGRARWTAKCCFALCKRRIRETPAGRQASITRGKSTSQTSMSLWALRYKHRSLSQLRRTRARKGSASQIIHALVTIHLRRKGEALSKSEARQLSQTCHSREAVAITSSNIRNTTETRTCRIASSKWRKVAVRPASTRQMQRMSCSSQLSTCRRSSRTSRSQATTNAQNSSL